MLNNISISILIPKMYNFSYASNFVVFQYQKISWLWRWIENVQRRCAPAAYIRPTRRELHENFGRGRRWSFQEAILAIY